MKTIIHYKDIGTDKTSRIVCKRSFRAHELLHSRNLSALVQKNTSNLDRAVEKMTRAISTLEVAATRAP